MNAQKLNSRPTQERIHDEMIETVDEELEMEIDDDRLADLLEQHAPDQLPQGDD